MLQFIAIKRRDTGEWALPGGMVDPGEKVATTAIREFQEEALNSLETSAGIILLAIYSITTQDILYITLQDNLNFNKDFLDLNDFFRTH